MQWRGWPHKTRHSPYMSSRRIWSFYVKFGHSTAMPVWTGVCLTLHKYTPPQTRGLATWNDWESIGIRKRIITITLKRSEDRCSKFVDATLQLRTCVIKYSSSGKWDSAAAAVRNNSDYRENIWLHKDRDVISGVVRHQTVLQKVPAVENWWTTRCLLAFVLRNDDNVYIKTAFIPLYTVVNNVHLMFYRPSYLNRWQYFPCFAWFETATLLLCY